MRRPRPSPRRSKGVRRARSLAATRGTPRAAPRTAACCRGCRRSAASPRRLSSAAAAANLSSSPDDDDDDDDDDDEIGEIARPSAVPRRRRPRRVGRDEAHAGVVEWVTLSRLTAAMFATPNTTTGTTAVATAAEVGGTQQQQAAAAGGDAGKRWADAEAAAAAAALEAESVALAAKLKREAQSLSTLLRAGAQGYDEGDAFLAAPAESAFTKHVNQMLLLTRPADENEVDGDCGRCGG